MCEGTRISHVQLFHHVFPNALFLMTPEYVGPPVRVPTVAPPDLTLKAWDIAAGSMPVMAAENASMQDDVYVVYVSSHKYRTTDLTEDRVRYYNQVREGKMDLSLLTSEPSAIYTAICNQSRVGHRVLVQQPGTVNPDNWWGRIRCDCPTFFQRGVCAHTLVVGNWWTDENRSTGLVDLEGAKERLPGNKPKGRPRKNAPALQKQPTTPPQQKGVVAECYRKLMRLTKAQLSTQASLFKLDFKKIGGRKGKRLTKEDLARAVCLHLTGHSEEGQCT